MLLAYVKQAILSHWHATPAVRIRSPTCSPWQTIIHHSTSITPQRHSTTAPQLQYVRLPLRPACMCTHIIYHPLIVSATTATTNNNECVREHLTPLHRLASVGNQHTPLARPLSLAAALSHPSNPGPPCSTETPSVRPVVRAGADRVCKIHANQKKKMGKNGKIRNRPFRPPCIQKGRQCFAPDHQHHPLPIPVVCCPFVHAVCSRPRMGYWLAPLPRLPDFLPAGYIHL